MQYVPHDRPVRYLGVVGMGIVNGVVFPLADIRSERLSMIFSLLVVGAAVMLYKVSNPRIRARRVVRRIRKSEDVIILPDGKPLDFPELRILQLLREKSEVMLPACFFGGECFAEALDRASGFIGKIEG
jgi:hypothetical protein